MILAGGRVPELEALTARRAKGAVPFGGLYRVIDFPLTNLMQSRIGVAGIMSQYRPYSLIDHVGDGRTWDFAGHGKTLRVLPPYWGRQTQQWYNGTADALWQNADFIRRHDAEQVLILSGDHVYRMDYRPLIEYHRAKDADATIVVKRVPDTEASRYGITRMDATGRLFDYEEKPEQPKGNLASLTIYIFNRDVLLAQLERHRPATGERYHIYRNILPEMVKSHRVFGYRFDGYWHYTRTLDEYFQAHRDLVGEKPQMTLAEWAVVTNLNSDGLGELGPTLAGPAAGIVGSYVAPGCRIYGQVHNSVLAPGVTVEAGAIVRDAVLNARTLVGAGAHVQWCIADKEVQIGAGAQIRGTRDAAPNPRTADTLSMGMAVLGKGCRIPAGASVGGNTIISPGVTAPQSVADGENIGVID